jgi:hypothetical protein
MGKENSGTHSGFSHLHLAFFQRESYFSFIKGGAVFRFYSPHHPIIIHSPLGSSQTTTPILFNRDTFPTIRTASIPHCIILFV